MIKVLIINTVPTELSGITKAIFSYVKFINNNEVVFDYVSINEIPDFWRTECDSIFSNIFVLSRNSNPIKYYNRLKHIIKNGKYDIVHAHGNSRTLAVEMLAAKKAHCNVRIAHGHNSSCKHKILHRLLYPFFKNACNYGLACSKYAGDFLFGKLPYQVIYNGINADSFKFDSVQRNEVRKGFNIPADAIVVGDVARLVSEKNQIFLIEVLQKLLNIDNKYRLLLIGDGPDRNMLEEEIDKRGLKDFVYMLGAVDSQKFFSAIDIIAMPSIFEGLPISLIEEQSNGLPCLVSDTVTRQVDIGKVQFLPINQGSDVWAHSICNMDHTIRISQAYEANLTAKASDFNIANTSKQLIEFYHNSIMNKG